MPIGLWRAAQGETGKLLAIRMQKLPPSVYSGEYTSDPYKVLVLIIYFLSTVSA